MSATLAAFEEFLLNGWRSRTKLIYQFPAAGTMGCTMQACAMRDAKEKNATFKRHPELEVVGISPGTSHIAFFRMNGCPIEFQAVTFPRRSQCALQTDT